MNLEPIKERLNAATPGPWYTFYGGEPNLIGAPREKNNELLAEFWGPSHDGRSPDADFVAHARNHDVRELIHEVERQADILKRAMVIITDAIMHGMPVTEEVAAVRNAIVCGKVSE